MIGRNRAWRQVGTRVAFAVLGLMSGPAAALEPLTAFLDGAERSNLDVVAARALGLQRAAEADASLGRLLPSLSIGGTYTRNQYSAKLPFGNRIFTLAPHNQLDAQAGLTVPVLDIVAWARRRVAVAQSDAARHDARGAAIEVGRHVVQQYYNLSASEGVLSAAERSLRVSQEHRGLVEARATEGAASSLEVAQVKSDEALAAQNVASADLAVRLSRRALYTLSGMDAAPAEKFALVSLHGEKPLEAWMALVDDTLPTLASSRATERAARAGHNAASWAYIPTFSAKLSERVTNATALNGGHPHVYTFQGLVSWQLDGNLIAQPAVQRHQLAVASARARSTRNQWADQLFQDYHQIEAARAKSLAARAQVEFASAAETLANEKAEAGLVTQLDVMQARRDAFQAEVNRISSDADVLYYRAALRLDAGIGALAEGP